MKKWKIIAVFALLAPLGGCDKGFEDLNVNPNIPESTDPAYLFAHAQHAYFTNYFHGVLTQTWGLNVWMQTQADLSGIATLDDAYFIGGDALDNTWSLYYATVLGNLDAASRLAEASGDQKQVAVITVFKAFVMQQLTDLWGDVPYSEAFGAVTENAPPNFAPAYDSQRSVYLALIDELQWASTTLSGQADVFGAQDWIFGGQEERWQELANSLLLRMCIRMSAVEPELSADVAGAVLLEGNLLQTQDALFSHSSFARSPFFELHNTGQGMRSPSQFLVDLLQADFDPRVVVYADIAPETIILGAPDYVGVPNFLISSEIDPDEFNAFTTSYIGLDFQQEDGFTPLMTVAEVEFLLAEAALLGWPAPMGAEGHCNAGVLSHMDLLGVDSATAQSYLVDHPYDGTLEYIATEKWKTLIYTNPIEQFSEYRRLGFPMLTHPDGSPINTQDIPARLAYPQVEISLNGNQVSQVGEGINDFHTPVWWDIN